MCSSHSNVTSELPVGSNGTGTSSPHQSVCASEPSRASALAAAEAEELQALRDTCCHVVPGVGGGGPHRSHSHHDAVCHHAHGGHAHHGSHAHGGSAACTDETCHHLTVFSSPPGSRRGSREFLQQPDIHHNHIGHSRNSLTVESRNAQNKDDDQHSIYSLSDSDTDEEDEEESIYTPRTSRAHSMRSRRSRASTSMLSARSEQRSNRSKSFCVSSVCGSDYSSHPSSQKRKGTVSDLSLPNGHHHYHHHGPLSPSPSSRTSPTHMRCRSPSLLDPVSPSPAPPPYSGTCAASACCLEARRAGCFTRCVASPTTPRRRRLW